MILLAESKADAVHMTRNALTGGAGIIGSKIVGHLVEPRQEVIVIDELSSGHMVN